MAEKDCLNNENELNSSIIGSNEVQSQLNIDNLSSELGENSDISSVLAIDDINSEMNPDLSTDSNLSENNQVESELDIPVSIQGEIPEIPTKLSEFENDVGFITLDDIPEYPENLSELNNDVGFITKNDLPELPDTSNLVDKSELNNYVSKEELSQEGFLKEIPEEYITQEELNSSISNKANKDEIPDISGKADKSEIPDISGLATKTEVQSKSEEILKSANDYTDTKVAELIDSAPETLDTFKEIADAFAEDQEVLDTLNSAIGLKADKTALTETNLRVASLEENKADKSEIPDISGKADKSELNNYVTNTALEGKGYLTSIPTEYVTESELTAKDYATNTTVNGKLGKSENAVSATKATQDSDGNVIKDTYLKKSGGTLTGQLVNNSSVRYNMSFIDQYNNPTSTQYKVTDWFYDKNNKPVGVRHLAQFNSGKIEQQIDVRRDINNNGTTSYASLIVGMEADGTSYAKAPNPASSSDTNDIATTAWVKDRTDTFLPLAGGTMSGAVDMNNFDITNANKLTFADAGYGEGIEWNQGNGWRINECPNDLSNNKGNLQFISSNTRRATIGTDGKVEATGGFTFPNATSTYINGNKGTNVAINMTANAGYNILSRIKSTNGVFTQGVHSGDCKLLYTADSVISAGTNGTTKQAILLNESGNSTFPGIVYSNIHAYKNSSFGRGDTAGPSSNIYNQPLQVRDKNEKTISAVETGVMTDRRTMINMICYKGTSATDSSNARIEVGWNSDGTSYTYCGVTPPTTSNDNQIATTSWVKDSIDITGKTTTILSLVKGLINTSDYKKSAKYVRWFVTTDGGSSGISDKPTGTTNGGFVCEAICNRLVSATDYRYILRCYVQANTQPYTAIVAQNTTSIEWKGLYRHIVYLTNDALRLIANVITTSSAMFTLSTFRTWVHQNGFNATTINGAFYPVSGGAKSGYSSVYGISSNGTSDNSKNYLVFYQLDSGTTTTGSYNFTGLLDTVSII